MKKQEMVDAEKRVMPVVSGGARHRTGHGRACSRLKRCYIDDKQNKRREALRRWRQQMTGLAAGVTALMCLLTLWPAQAQAAELPIQSRAALLMEKTTGQVLYARNEHEQLEPASVTKIMTLLLTMEAIDSGAIGCAAVGTVSASAAGLGDTSCKVHTERLRSGISGMVRSSRIVPASKAGRAYSRVTHATPSPMAARSTRSS